MECKFHKKAGKSTIFCELIDTLWNVNLNIQKQVMSVTRINRYIMECKFKCSEMGRRFYKELIDTLWNVNMLLQPRTMLAGRINRYIMECKFLYVTIYSIGT